MRTFLKFASLFVVLFSFAACAVDGSFDPITAIGEKIAAHKEAKALRASQISSASPAIRYRMTSNEKYTDEGELVSPQSVKIAKERSDLVVKINDPATSATEIAIYTEKVAALADQIRAEELRVLAEIDVDLSKKIQSGRQKISDLEAKKLTPPDALKTQVEGYEQARTLFAAERSRWENFPLGFTGDRVAPSALPQKEEAAASKPTPAAPDATKK